MTWPAALILAVALLLAFGLRYDFHYATQERWFSRFLLPPERDILDCPVTHQDTCTVPQ